MIHLKLLTEMPLYAFFFIEGNTKKPFYVRTKNMPMLFDQLKKLVECGFFYMKIFSLSTANLFMKRKFVISNQQRSLTCLLLHLGNHLKSFALIELWISIK